MVRVFDAWIKVIECSISANVTNSILDQKHSNTQHKRRPAHLHPCSLPHSLLALIPTKGCVFLAMFSASVTRAVARRAALYVRTPTVQRTAWSPVASVMVGSNSQVMGAVAAPVPATQHWQLVRTLRTTSGTRNNVALMLLVWCNVVCWLCCFTC